MLLVVFTNSLKKSTLKNKFLHRVHHHTKTQSKQALPASAVAAPAAATSAEFYFQKIYPGKDPLKYLELSAKAAVKKYIVVQNGSIYYGRNELLKSIIEDQIDIHTLYDKDVDSAVEGKCCHRLSVIDHPEVVMCGPVTCKSLISDPSKVTEKQKDNNPYLATHCLDIEIFNVDHWRICHRSKDMINKLKMNLVREAVQLNVPKVTPAMMTKIFMNSNSEQMKAPKLWNWMEQEKWGGNCNSGVMQSPSAISLDPLAASLSPRFGMVFDFPNNIPIAIRKNGEEAVVDLLPEGKNTGTIRVEFGTYEVMIKEFHPRTISFRFPSEHTLNDNRYDGDIIIHAEEATENDDRKLSLSNGLNWVIPMKFDSKAPLIPELEQLQPDFWRFELGHSKSFKPRDLKDEKQSLFDLKNFVEILKPLKTDFAFYLGSNTTPPCEDKVFYLINMKHINVANCQFKIFRENALLSSREKETHARKLQENAKGGKIEVRLVKGGDLKPAKRPAVIHALKNLIKFNAGAAPVEEPLKEVNCDLSRS